MLIFIYSTAKQKNIYIHLEQRQLQCVLSSTLSSNKNVVLCSFNSSLSSLIKPFHCFYYNHSSRVASSRGASPSERLGFGFRIWGMLSHIRPIIKLFCTDTPLQALLVWIFTRIKRKKSINKRVCEERRNYRGGFHLWGRAAQTSELLAHNGDTFVAYSIRQLHTTIV